MADMLPRPHTPPRRVDATRAALCLSASSPPSSSPLHAAGRGSLLARVARPQARTHVDTSVCVADVAADKHATPTTPRPRTPSPRVTHTARVPRARAHHVVATDATRTDETDDNNDTCASDHAAVSARSPSARLSSVDAHGMTDDDDEEDDNNNTNSDKEKGNDSTSDNEEQSNNNNNNNISHNNNKSDDDEDDTSYTMTTMMSLHDAARTQMATLLREHACALVRVAAAAQLHTWCAPYCTALLQRVSGAGNGDNGDSSATTPCAVLPLLFRLAADEACASSATTTCTRDTNSSNNDNSSSADTHMTTLLTAYYDDVYACHTRALQHCLFDELYTHAIALPATAALALHGRTLLCMQRDAYMRSRIELFMQLARRCYYTSVVHESARTSRRSNNNNNTTTEATAAAATSARVSSVSMLPPSSWRVRRGTDAAAAAAVSTGGGLLHTMRRALQLGNVCSTLAEVPSPRASITTATTTAAAAATARSTSRHTTMWRVCEVHVETAEEAARRRAAQQRRLEAQPSQRDADAAAAATRAHAQSSSDGGNTLKPAVVLPCLHATQHVARTLHVARRRRSSSSSAAAMTAAHVVPIDELFVSIADHGSRTGA